MRTKTFGQVVKQSRDSRELTQRQLAGRLGVKASHIAYLESGQRRPSIRLLIRIAKVLDLEGKELLFLAHPEARHLVTDSGAKDEEAPRSAWERFVSDKALLKRNHVAPAERQFLKRVSLLKSVTRPDYFLSILNSIRQATEEN